MKKILCMGSASLEREKRVPMSTTRSMEDSICFKLQCTRDKISLTKKFQISCVRTHNLHLYLVQIVFLKNKLWNLICSVRSFPSIKHKIKHLHLVDHRIYLIHNQLFTSISEKMPHHKAVKFSSTRLKSTSKASTSLTRRICNYSAFKKASWLCRHQTQAARMKLQPSLMMPKLSMSSFNYLKW